MCAEIELLLCCARTCVDSKTAARVKVLLRQGVDLAYLMRIARRHGLLPLVYWNLHKVCPVPKDVSISYGVISGLMLSVT